MFKQSLQKKLKENNFGIVLRIASTGLLQNYYPFLLSKYENYDKRCFETKQNRQWKAYSHNIVYCKHNLNYEALMGQQKEPNYLHINITNRKS